MELRTQDGREDVVVAPDHLYEGYIFDLDGTIYLGDDLLPGAQRLIARLREDGKRIVFMSNNPTYDVEMYVDRLARLGIPADPDEIVTTVFTTTQWIVDNAPNAVVFPIAEEPLIRSLRRRGIKVSDNPAEIDIVVGSYDRGLTWEKLQIAFETRWHDRGAILICTNPDIYCPLPGGRGEVDAGAIVKALETAMQTTLVVNCGKPSPLMLEAAMKVLDLGPGQCLVVGDRLYTDVRMGIDAGIDTAIVFTGETTPENVADSPFEDRPTYALSRIDELLPSGGGTNAPRPGRTTVGHTPHPAQKLGE